MTTNQSESFNHVLMPYHDFPIIALVHFTFKQASSYFIERRDRMIGHHKYFVPKIETLNNTNLVKATHNEVQLYDESKGIASVLTKSKSLAHNVSMEAKTCGCGKWQLLHYPSVHAPVVCAQKGLSIRDCVTYEFTTQAYVDTWAQTFNSQSDMTLWNAYVGQKYIPNKQLKRVKKEDIQRSEDTAKWIKGVTQDPHTPRHTRDESMHDMPSLSASLGGEDTLLLDVSHIVDLGPIDTTLLYKQTTHRSNHIWETSRPYADPSNRGYRAGYTEICEGIHSTDVGVIATTRFSRQ
ncbi:hypothetical protein QQ045_023134 [Rhodiola kirilowii]